MKKNLAEIALLNTQIKDRPLKEENSETAQAFRKLMCILFPPHNQLRYAKPVQTGPNRSNPAQRGF